MNTNKPSNRAYPLNVLAGSLTAGALSAFLWPQVASTKPELYAGWAFIGLFALWQVICFLRDRPDGAMKRVIEKSQ